MNPTWQGEDPPPPLRPRGGAWLRVIGRGVPVALVTFGGLALHLGLRAVERPLFGLRRPWTGRVTRIVCRANLRLLGIAVRFEGPPAPAPAVVVANHSSWLDILALNAGQTLVFVAKAEVAGWPGIGWLARATGTLFIRRDRRETAVQVGQIRERLGAGERLVLFAEGTSSDGRRVLPFKPALFAAVMDERGMDGGDIAPPIQPVTLLWEAPAGADPRFYGWWGDMALVPHLLSVLAVPRQGRIRVIRHQPITAGPAMGRKDLALRAAAAVRAGFGEAAPEEADPPPARPQTGPSA
ncbi:MAG: 1-acyl-sn-glycerol-3-phosphate acyltransferase [Rubellimicrobium sp.]|nr:1-acyl-sn-glycerol-3-phosphate acyltransferase [Rubellimicrobium sp.]